MNSNSHVVAVVDMQDLKKYLYRCITIFFANGFVFHCKCRNNISTPVSLLTRIYIYSHNCSSIVVALVIVVNSIQFKYNVRMHDHAIRALPDTYNRKYI